MFKENKKAQIGEAMTLGLATLIIILLIIAFFLISILIAGVTSKNIESGSITMSSKEEAITSLLAYLQTPISISVDEKEQNMSIADLIRLWAKDKNSQKLYKEKLKEETSNIFDAVYACYELRIPYYEMLTPYFAPNSKAEESGCFSVGKNPPLVFKDYAEVTLPLQNERLSKVRLLARCTKK